MSSLEQLQPGANQRVRWKKRLLWISAIFAVSALAGFFLLTGSSASTGARGAPTAEQVVAGRDAVYQLKDSRAGSGGNGRIQLEVAQLDGLSALATNGFRPGRLNLYVRKKVFHATASYPMPAGRWLNVDFAVKEPSRGFPKIYTKIGSLKLSPYFSRMMFNVGRTILQWRGADIPPLDAIISGFAISNGSIVASVRLPTKSGLVDQLGGAVSGLDSALVVTAYCRLAKLQAADPQPEFAVHVNRAFAAARSSRPNPQQNQAAFMALAMLVVDKRVGYLADIDENKLAKCSAPVVPIQIHGRGDLPKHWALSAALTVGTGNQLAKSMGEWKEMADSVSRQSEFQIGDPSGFSFIDLSADRAGLRIANAASSAGGAAAVAKRLAVADADQLLPKTLLSYPEGLNDRDFERIYGGTDDPRYSKVVSDIDAALDRAGILVSAKTGKSQSR